MKRILGIISCLVLVGCTSTEDRLLAYVGQPVQMAAINNGPPTHYYDLAKGKRAFQWEKVIVRQLPGSSTTSSYGSATGQATKSGNTVFGNAYGQSSSTTTYTPAQQINSTCRYTLYADWDDPRQTWIVSGIEKPRFGC